MIQPFYELFSFDLPEDVSILRLGGVLHDMYLDLACKRCGKLDELAALRRGVDPALQIPDGPDMWVSAEWLTVVRLPLLECMLSVPGADVEVFRIPSAAEFRIIYPRRVFLPVTPLPLSQPVGPQAEPFRMTRPPCKVCGRSGEVTVREELYPIPGDTVMAATKGESRKSATLGWIVSKEVVEALRKSTFGGWRTRQIGVFD